MGRVIDELGRIVIPNHIREKCDIREGDKYDFKFIIDKETGVKELFVVLSQNHCAFCGVTENLTNIGKSYICPQCINKTKEL